MFAQSFGNLILAALAATLIGSFWQKARNPKQYLAIFLSSLAMTFILFKLLDYLKADTLYLGLRISFWAWLGFILPTQLVHIPFDTHTAKPYLFRSILHLTQILAIGFFLKLSL